MARATRLDRDRVVATALRLLDEAGLEGVTLRKVAQALDVKAPALYWHFANKQALLDEMATAMFRAMREEPLPDTGDWREGLAEVHRRLRRALLKHRDGAKVFSGTRLTDTDHAAWMEEQLGRLVAAGFDPHAAARAAFIVYSFTEGFVIEEQGVHPMPGERTPGFDTAERARRMGPEYPLTTATGDDLFDGYEERFEEGLRAVITGVAATLGPA
ncbi:TetR/AcrR family transcriptional regulator C-terminal domain-containing protein [Streptomyces sp. HNM0574]|uniref:TetR/AcrR family transcriptional regulator C-terminal domain-containing protein n=1 Tax=Streptomyces sp. HNM0574 TaxID=2714954 RepID=UPI001469BABA|nr:TetR/AcrR family transcriptional regulator C-terminal domain-containing protein [Streptomyces sp. HNM0574]NLU66791.1 TetR family transcriptional regulator [Streptomyces sp. HNM0574]